ncbi:hypothetical protein CDO24_20225 (plasmid) [Sinorhizobium meliloti]|nr:hypothetical protein CDO24_20225 [Sinorhizobium meliloti]
MECGRADTAEPIAAILAAAAAVSPRKWRRARFMSEDSLLLDIGLPFMSTSTFAHFILCSSSLEFRHSIYADSNAAGWLRARHERKYDDE